MKININKIKTTPKNLPFALCVYGNPSNEILEWMTHWNIKSVTSSDYTNFILPENISLNDIFEDPNHYNYVDAFSPNLNKKLHFGHLANLITAKFIQKIGLGDTFISVLGDTLSGKIDKEEALNDFYHYCQLFDYEVNKIFYASEQKMDNSI